MKIFIKIKMENGLVDDVTASRFPLLPNQKDTADKHWDNGCKTFAVDLEDEFPHGKFSETWYNKGVED